MAAGLALALAIPVPQEGVRLRPGEGASLSAACRATRPSVCVGEALLGEAHWVSLAAGAACAVAAARRSPQRGRQRRTRPRAAASQGTGTKRPSPANTGAQPGSAWRRSATSRCAVDGHMEDSVDWHSASSIRRAWRLGRRESIVGSVRAGWAESVTCLAANKGPQSQCMTPTNLALVGSPPLLWVAFVDTDAQQGMQRAALAKLLFQDVCDTLGSSHMLECAASCTAPVSRSGLEDTPLELPAHFKAAAASPDFAVRDDLHRFDVLVAMSEGSREQIVGSDPTGAFAHKVVCLTDFVDGCDTWPDEVDSLPADIKAEHILQYIDLPTGPDQLAVILRSLVGLENFLMRQYPQDMASLLHPCLIPRSFSPEMHAMLETLN